jgi:hypothetical protein
VGQSLHGFGPAQLKAARKRKIPFLFPNQFPNTQEWINLRKYLGTSENYGNFSEGGLEYLGQLLYWALWPKVNGIQMKNRIQIWTWVWIRFDWIYSKLGSNSWLQ